MKNYMIPRTKKARAKMEKVLERIVAKGKDKKVRNAERTPFVIRALIPTVHESLDPLPPNKRLQTDERRASASS